VREINYLVSLPRTGIVLLLENVRFADKTDRVCWEIIPATLIMLRPQGAACQGKNHEKNVKTTTWRGTIVLGGRFIAMPPVVVPFAASGEALATPHAANGRRAQLL
jgi:hypothetical protein